MGTEGPPQFQNDSVGETALALELEQTERAGQLGLSPGPAGYYLHEVDHSGYFLDFRFFIFKQGLKISLASRMGLW